MSTDGQPGLDLGPLDLVSRTRPEGTYSYHVLGDDFSKGKPEAVREIFKSLLIDGDLNRRKRHGNRKVEFLMEIEGDDLDAVTAGETAFEIELYKIANDLVYTPPDGYGAASVFTMVDGDIGEIFDDLDELSGDRRTFEVMLECLPYTKSLDPVTFTWTGPGTQLRPLNVTTGWTVVGGGSLVSAGFPPFFPTSLTRSGGGSITAKTTVTLGTYLWLVTDAQSTLPVKIDGETIDTDIIRREPDSPVSPTSAAFTVPTERWRGRTVEVEVTFTTLLAFWSVQYPNVWNANAAAPHGLGVVDIIGSARCPCVITFTAPSGGAFVYTGPDPNEAIRERGVSEIVWSHFEVTDEEGVAFTIGGRTQWVPEGTWTKSIGFTDPQPLEIHPDGVWPRVEIGGEVWAYPDADGTAISYFETTGVKNLVSPTPALPQGYHADAKVVGQHSLYPGRTGFAVMNEDGIPISCTVTYYPHWWTNAGQ